MKPFSQPVGFSVVFAVLGVASCALGAEEPRAQAAAPEGETSGTTDNEGPDRDFPEGYVSEGPLPEGFPPPSKVGEIVEKDYPESRSYSAAGSNAFMQCFTYLQKHRHEMTAPVVMDVSRKSAAKPKEDSEENFISFDRMHFLLEKRSLDSPKTEGAITVGDMPKMHVISFAHRGPIDDEIVKSSEERLRARLAERTDLKADSALRVLGYNGPATPPAKQYWEIQLPVKRAADNR